MRSLTFVNRRSLLFGGSAAVVATLLATESHAAPARYSLGKLAGRPAADLYAAYIGFSGRGVLPKTMVIDWNARLSAMWAAKVTRSRNSATVKRTRMLLTTEFALGSRRQMSIRQYQQGAEREARFVHQQLDWNKVGRMYLAKKGKVNARKLRLLKNVAGQIGGRALVAYALTELMPGRNDGGFNRDFLDFLLRTGGRAYVERIPALYDRFTSFGPYQFTQYAVYDSGNERRGASVVNLALPAQHRIPGSVIKLRGNEHSKAAYLFVVSNLATLIKRLNDKQLATFERVWRTSAGSIVEFIAVAHHAPALAFRAGQRWLDNNATLPFRRSCSGRTIQYADKTAVNYRALA